MKIAEQGQMETQYNQKQKNLEELKENDDQTAAYRKWQVEDLLPIWKTAD